MFKIDLTKAKVKKGLRNETQPYIYMKEETVIIRISFHNDSEFEKWLRIALQAQRSDEQLEI